MPAPKVDQYKRVEQAPVSGRRLLAALCLWAALAGAVVGALLVLARVLAPGWSRSHRPVLNGLLLAGAYLALLVALALVFGGPRGFRDRLGFRFTSWADAGGALLLWLGALVAGGLLTVALRPLLGPPPDVAARALRLSGDPLYLGLIVATVCLLGPFCEELLFRGALLGWLRSRLPAWAAVAISGSLFAAAHVLPATFPALLLFGLAAGYVRVRTGSTLNTLLMHVTQNTLAVVAAYALLRTG